MPKLLNERQYRGAIIFQPSQIENTSSYQVEGYATTFDTPYNLFKIGNEQYKEVIRSSAFKNCDMSDVIMQFDHEGRVIARISNKTLSIEVRKDGLFILADLSKSDLGRSLFEDIRNGLISKMSWGFRVAPGGYELDEETKTFYVNEVEKIYDVSAVSLPANKDTEISARSLGQGIIDLKNQELIERKRIEKKRKSLSLLIEMEEI